MVISRMQRVEDTYSLTYVILFSVCFERTAFVTHPPSTTYNNKSRFVTHLLVLVVVFIVYKNLDDREIVGTTFLGV